MAKYKLLRNYTYLYPNLKAGEIYDITMVTDYGICVGDLTLLFPDDWQLIEEKQEKRPIMTYIILSAMMLLYLYAGLAEINWPLIPATILGFYLLIKNKRNGRKKIL